MLLEGTALQCDGMSGANELLKLPDVTRACKDKSQGSIWRAMSFTQ